MNPMDKNGNPLVYPSEFYFANDNEVRAFVEEIYTAFIESAP